MHVGLETEYFSRPARISHGNLNQIQCVSDKDERRATPVVGKTKRKASAAAEVYRVANLFLTGGLLFDACFSSRAVEDLDPPQHDDDGRYQRGRRQYTF
jgi:hypothetical protein